MTRRSAEAVFAVLFAGAILVVGGAVLYFVFTISPVHTDTAAVPSTASAAHAERYWAPWRRSGAWRARCSSKRICRASRSPSPWMARLSGPRASAGPTSNVERR